LTTVGIPVTFYGMTGVGVGFLPSLPDGERWEIKNKRSWQFLCLKRKTWYGWKTIGQQSLEPSGLGLQYALTCASEDILRDIYGRVTTT
jgi:hypothetical protein